MAQELERLISRVKSLNTLEIRPYDCEVESNMRRDKPLTKKQLDQLKNNQKPTSSQ